MDYKIFVGILSAAALLVLFHYEKLILGNEFFIANVFRQRQVGSSSGLLEPDQIKIGTFWREERYGMKLCPEKPPGLNGTIPVDLRTPKPAEIEQEYPQLEMGGYWRPPNCTARHRVAVIVPYKSGEKRHLLGYLLGFLHHIHGFLQRQQLEYAIFVVEQADELMFNRGKLLNIGFVEALRHYDWQCFVFHDISSLPENDLNLYSCPENSSIVKHMVHGFKKSGYKPYYDGYFGGAIILTEDGYRRINGYSNDFWGWGGEDDDLLARVKLAGIEVRRSSQEIGRYRQFPDKHNKDNSANPCRHKMLERTEQKKSTDGLSNLKYRLKSISYSRLYTLIQVHVLQEQYDD